MYKNSCEELLTAWLRLSAVIRNERMVKYLTFREVFILNILTHADKDSFITATDIIEITGMLKSQVNKVLTDLEEEGFITREKDKTDKRKIHIMITEKGEEIYKKEHDGILNILDKVCEKLGEKRIDTFVSEIYSIVDAIEAIYEV
ncbi:MAG: winged helix DNA-binding protein [Lachnospiraceae bacterium]|nr:winged helix DNA-binding protein [Lachnospiraceae bacterium]